MAKLKRTSKSAAKAAATKKPATQAVAKAAKKLSVGKPAKASAKAVAKPGPRRKQRVAISHYQEEAFLGDGLRAYAKYRDLGVAAATGG